MILQLLRCKNLVLSYKCGAKISITQMMKVKRVKGKTKSGNLRHEIPTIHTRSQASIVLYCNRLTVSRRKRVREGRGKRDRVREGGMKGERKKERELNSFNSFFRYFINFPTKNRRCKNFSKVILDFYGVNSF